MPETVPAPAKKANSKGERTRRVILEAALDVIAEQGLRSVTHRAVATQARVQLSLTTYYFKDIAELIEQAFAHFCEGTREEYQLMWNDVFAYLDQFSATQLRRKDQRDRICATLSERATDYLTRQILDKPRGLAVEQILFTEIRLDPQLRTLAQSHRDSLMQPIVECCRRFNRHDPEIDAELLLDTFTRLEYQTLLLEEGAFERERILTLVRRQLGWVMGLVRA